MSETTDNALIKRVLLVVAYDGTGYSGYQAQPGGVPTIEGELNRAILELTGEEVEVIGGSRTDAGVHALQNVAVFDTASRIPAEKFSYALNSRLPAAIRIQKSVQVDPDFHPRHQNCVKTYEYRIYSAPFPSPLKDRYSFYTYRRFDMERMQAAGNYLVGEHDFTSFSSIYSQAKSAVRTITSLEVFPRDGEIVIRVSGTGFLYNMVRIIAGTLMEAGEGRRTAESIRDTLEAKDRRAAGPTAPPQGLTLVRYRFEDHPELTEI